MLNLHNRAVLFIGGGWETSHKVLGLLHAGAKVTLLSKHHHPELEELAGKLVWHKRNFAPGDCTGFWLVMSHPIDKAENAAVYAEAESNGILCNSVDDPKHCSFILPSVLKRDDLTIAISTSGVAPALAVRIKQKLAEQYGPEYASFLKILRQLRPGITNAFANFETRKQLWYSLIDSEALAQLKNNQTELATKTLQQQVKTQQATCQEKPCEHCNPQNCSTLSAKP